jgi:hypothetical protein
MRKGCFISVFVTTSRKNPESSTVHFEVFITGDVMALKLTLKGGGGLDVIS